MIISKATKKDRKELLNFFKHYKINDLAKKRVECYTNYASTIIAKEKDKIIGVLQWYVKEDPKAGVAEFEELFVKKEYRSRGIGLRLVEAGIKDVRSFFRKNNIKPRKIFLFISKSNIASRKLNKKLGFKFIAEVEDLFLDGESELFYCLDLRK